MAAICDFRGMIQGSPPWSSNSRTGLTLSGDFLHGGLVSINANGAANFGSRINSKPIYVYAGENSKNGSSLGRDTTDYFNVNATYQTDFKTGGFNGGIKYDFKDTFQGSFVGLVIPNETNPLIIYKHIYRAFDQNDPNYQNEIGGFNLKTHRLYSTLGTSNNFYVGKDGFGFVENITPQHPSRYYSYVMPAFQWANELLYFINSTEPSFMNGRFYHEVNNVWLNTDPEDSLLTTYDSTQNGLLNSLNLDQISNGSGSNIAEVPQYLDYLIIDDEVLTVWLGDNPLVTECDDIYPVPTVSWVDNQIQFVPLFSNSVPTTYYVYILMSWDKTTNTKTWLTPNGIPTV